MTPKCLNCGCEELIGDVTVVDRSHGNLKKPLMLETYKNPDAFLFRGAQEAYAKARVCAQCGFVMIFTDPKGISSLKG